MTTAPLCPVCGLPLDDGRPIQTSLDGSGVHADCVPEPTDEGDDV